MLEGGGPSLDGLRLYRGKLRRAQAYCFLATCGGASLFVRSLLYSHEPPDAAVLSSYSPAHQVFFAMAVGHWAVTIWEDWRTRRFLGQGFANSICPGLVSSFAGVERPRLEVLRQGH